MLTAALGKNNPRARLPESVARSISKTGTVITKDFPLTESRIDAMTTRITYPIGNIQAALGYHHKVTLKSGIVRLVDFWKTII